MTLDGAQLAQFFAVVTAIGVILMVSAFYAVLLHVFRRPRGREKLESLAQDTRPNTGPERWYACGAALGITVLLVCSWYLQNLTLAVAGGGLVFVLMSFTSNHVSSRRNRQLELTLPLALQQIANEMASTGSLDRALQSVGESTPSPAREELALLRSRLAALGLEEALERTAQSLKSESFSLMAAVVRVGMQRGGNTIQALKDLSTTLIELERLRRKIRTASASSRRAMMLMAGIAPVVLIATFTALPNGDQLLSDPKGQTALGVAGALMVGALYLFLRFTRIKV